MNAPRRLAIRNARLFDSLRARFVERATVVIEGDLSTMQFGGEGGPKKAWKDIWGCGQGIGAVKAVVPTAELVARLRREYVAARERLAVLSGPVTAA